MPKRKRNIIHQRYATGDKQGQCKNNCTGCVHQRYASGCCKKDCTGCTFASNSRGSVTVLKKKKKKQTKTVPLKCIGGRKGQIVVIDYAGTDYDAKILADWGNDTYAIQYNDPSQQKKFSGEVTEVIQGLSIQWNVKSKLVVHPFVESKNKREDLEDQEEEVDEDGEDGEDAQLIHGSSSSSSFKSSVASSSPPSSPASPPSESSSSSRWIKFASASSVSSSAAAPSVTNKNVQSTTFRANKLKGWTIDDSGSQRVYISPNGDRSTALMLAAAGSIDSICPTSADGSIDFAHMTEHQQFKHLESLSSTSSLTADQDGSLSNHHSSEHCNACDGQHRAHTCGKKGQNKTTFMSDNASLMQQYQPDPNVQRERRSKKAADVSSNSFSKSKSSKNSKSSNFQSSSSSSSSTNQLINYRLQPSQPPQPSQPSQPPQPPQPSQPPLLPQNQKDTTAQTSSSTLSIKLYRCKHCEFESKEKKICSNPSDKHQKNCPRHQKNCPRHLTNKNTDTKSKTTSVQKQKQIRYTDEENQALVEGHMQFGTKWSDTLVKYRDVFHPCRGNASLSNRYNYIVKNENALFVSRLIFLLALLSSNLFHCFCHVLFLFQTPPNKSFVYF